MATSADHPTAPILMSLPRALSYARLGYAIRRAIWDGEAGNREIAWVFYHGGLFFYKTATVCRVVDQDDDLSPGDLDPDDHRASDWTLLPPGCVDAEACACDEDDDGYPIFDDEEPCSLINFENPNARLGLSGCNLPPRDGSRERCENCPPTDPESPWDPMPPPDPPDPDNPGDPRGLPPLRPIPGPGDDPETGGGFLVPGGGGGGPGGGSGSGGGGRPPRRKGDPCAPVSIINISDDYVPACVPRLIDGSGYYTIKDLQEIEITWNADLRIGNSPDGKDHLYWVTTRFQNEVIDQAIRGPGDSWSLPAQTLSGVPEQCFKLHVSLYLPLTGCKSSASAWLCWPDHCAEEEGS